MTEMTAFERRVADGMLHRAGPVRPVNDLAVFETVIAANRPKRWESTMLSALKFAVAGVIVALFGGILLTGILTTQQDGETPAAVTESPSPMTTAELLSGMVTEEVEPGVYRVGHDGVRDLSYELCGYGCPEFNVDVTPNGSVWLSVSSGEQGLFRLGEEAVFDDIEGFYYHRREVAPDGSLWASGWDSDRGGVFSFDGEGWTVRATAPDLLTALAIAADGTVWVVAEDGDKHCRPETEDDDCSGSALLRLEDDDSLTTIEDWSDVYDGEAALGQLAVSPDGDVWLVGTPRGAPSKADRLLRFDGERWEAIPGPERWDTGEIGRYLDVGPDGTLWVQADTAGGLARFDDSGWTVFKEADDLMQWSEDGSGTTDLLEVATDGSTWLNGGPPDEGYPGLKHFDGTTWTSYLAGTSIHDFAIGPDGSVWLGASGSDNHRGIDIPLGLYVITPEALAAKEADVTEPAPVEEATERENLATTEDLLSGMVSEEVEPGVFWVLNDGVRDIRSENNRYIVAGHDDGIWLLRKNRFLRLGAPGSHEWAAGKYDHEYYDYHSHHFEVASDGTVWVSERETGLLRTFDGEVWSTVRAQDARDGEESCPGQRGRPSAGRSTTAARSSRRWRRRRRSGR